MSVLSFDFNRFKEVNDLFGHAAGDELLMSAAQRLTHCFRRAISRPGWVATNSC